MTKDATQGRVPWKDAVDAGCKRRNVVLFRSGSNVLLDINMIVERCYLTKNSGTIE